MNNNNLKLKKKEIDNVINDSLSSIGFKKKKGLYVYSINDNMDILLIIEKTDRRTRNTIYINPIVAILDKQVEQLYYELVSDIDSSKEIVNTAIYNSYWGSYPAEYKIPLLLYKFLPR